MNHSDIKKSMSSAVHIYADLTIDEENAITQDTWAVTVEGVKYIGTTLPVIALAGKELIGQPTAAPVPAPSVGEFQTATMVESTDPIDGVLKQVWTVTNFPTADIKAILQERITQKRWDVETGGITLPNGIVVKTGIADQNRISNVVLNALRLNLETVDFKGASGWITLPLASVVAIADAITHHVQAGFTAEKMHCEAIIAIADTATQTAYEQLAAYDTNVGWPI